MQKKQKQLDDLEKEVLKAFPNASPSVIAFYLEKMKAMQKPYVNTQLLVIAQTQLN